MTDNEPIYASLGWHDLCESCKDWDLATATNGFPITLELGHRVQGTWEKFVLWIDCTCFNEEARTYLGFNEVDDLVKWLQDHDITANLYLDRRVLQQWGHLRKNDS